MPLKSKVPETRQGSGDNTRAYFPCLHTLAQIFIAAVISVVPAGGVVGGAGGGVVLVPYRYT